MTKVTGRDRLLAKMAAIPTEIRKEMAAALVGSAEEIAAFQRRLAPVKSGKLQRSISVNKGSRGPKYSQGSGMRADDKADPDLTVTITAGNSDVRYAHLVEFGTAPHENGGLYAGSQHPGAKAQPFFFPPYRALRRRAKGRASRATRTAIKRAVGR